MAPLPSAVLEALTSPEAYPGDPSASAGVEWIQTHISHVFLTGRRVYKFRKDVDLGFVDFSTLERRNRDCLREVSLNRRLAADVYLGVAPLQGAGTGSHLGPVGEALADGPAREHAVVMRRLPDGCDALSRLGRGALRAEHLDRLAQRIAAFHAEHRLGRPAPFTPEAWLERCRKPTDDCTAALEGGGGDERLARDVDRFRTAAGAFVERCADRFESRRRAGRAVDGHGDLHLQHVWFERDDAEPLVVDCLEFDEGLRHIDAASDVAFTAMDLRYRDAAGWGSRFLRRYASESDDFDLYRVVDYFAAYRAAVRAKVAAIAARDDGIAAEQRTRAAESVTRHLALALESLEESPTGALVLVCGVVGTGKSTVAEALAQILDEDPGAAVIASDRVRKHLAGVSPETRLANGRDAGAYAPDARRRVYDALLERAGPVVASGRTAILDATWESRARRRDVAALAERLGARLWIVEVRCAEGEARRRLRERREAGRGASDAGPELHAASRERFEGPGEEERASWRSIATDVRDWSAALRKLAAETR